MAPEVAHQTCFLHHLNSLSLVIGTLSSLQQYLLFINFFYVYVICVPVLYIMDYLISVMFLRLILMVQKENLLILF